jgi:hypothetical protein
MGDNLATVDLGAGRTALDISVTVNKTCALLDDYTVKCWGYNGFGNLGQPGYTPGIADPEFIFGGLPGTMGDHLPPIRL